MEGFLLSFFIILIISIPFAYRYIRLGSLGLYLDNDTKLLNNQNYKHAEKFRVIQVILGSAFFFIHGVFFWGLINIIIFFVIALVISFFMEIIGSKTGYVFGGTYYYNKNNTPGYILFGVPLLIPLAWFGIIYMSMNFCYFITDIKFPYDNIINNYYYIILTALLVVLLDTILDPIAVNENRWTWNAPGIYYGIPFLNFFGWFLTSIIILFLFKRLCHSTIIPINQFSLYFQYSPGILFIFLPIIASRPCFERGLKIPGYIGIFLSLFYIFISIVKY